MKNRAVRWWLVFGWLMASWMPTGASAATTENRLWDAHWITHPNDSGQGYGVFRFRKVLTLTEKPGTFVVHVSGDRRYRLFVNGTSVSVGPQRGDRFHWHYETVDIAPLLQAGKNVLAATVWNYGEDHPFALNSVRTAFILRGDGEKEKAANTDGSWRVYQETAYAPLLVDRQALKTFIVVGPGDRVDGRALEWRWADLDFNDDHWTAPRTLDAGTPEFVGTDLTWWLAPRNIPLPYEREQRLAAIRQQNGPVVEPAFLLGKSRWTVPPHTRASVLFDQGFETNAFPELRVAGGKGAICRLTYAEALVDASGSKGHRDEVSGRRIVGVQDEFIADGKNGRVFRPLMFRTYRYLGLEVETQDDPVEISDLFGRATGYPFESRGSFSSDDPTLAEVWDVGVRTAQLCAYETYVDCPYYEQMQYVGDTRIQALISLYAFGDDRLMRNAIQQFDRSRLAFGLTQSRVPTTTPQIIPPFSLFWIGMVHDYWMHRADDAFVQARLAGVRSVLAWFEERIDEKTQLLGPLPFWNFVDWPDEWPWVDSARPGGQPSGVREGGSAILSLQFAVALQEAADLAQCYGRADEAKHWRELRQRLVAAVRTSCWHAERKLFSDTAAKEHFSQHVNALAVLAGAIEGAEAQDLIRRVRDDATLTQCTLYFRFYLLRAAKQVGLGDDYLRSLGPWRDMLRRGLTTFAERPDPTRSDCHAWSASPVYDLLATVCGVEPSAPGFKRVRIEPHLGELTKARGRVPWRDQFIEVNVERDGERLKAEITLPSELTGEFVWRGKRVQLQPGRQTVEE